MLFNNIKFGLLHTQLYHDVLMTITKKAHIYLHFNDCLQGFGLCWLWSCFVSPVQLLRDTDTTAVIRQQREGMEGLSKGRRSWARRVCPSNWWKGLEGWLNRGCGPWGGSGVGWRTMDGMMNRGSNDKRGVVGRTGGSQDSRMNGVVMRWRGGYREWGRWWVTVWGGKIRRGVERGGHVERGRNRNRGRSRKRGRDGDWWGGRKKLFSSCWGTGFQSPWVYPSIPHPSNCVKLKYLSNLHWSKEKVMQSIILKLRLI